MKSVSIFIPNNVVDVKNLNRQQVIGDIARAMSPYIQAEKCLNTILVQSGSEANGRR